MRSLLLVTGSDDGLAELLIRQPDGPACAPVLRVAPEQLFGAAVRTGRAASLLLARGVAAGVRLGLEAHFLYAYARELTEEEEKRTGQDARLDAGYVQWCGLLAALAARLDTDGDQPLARDLASCGTRVFLLIDPYHDAPEDIVILGRAVAVFERLAPL